MKKAKISICIVAGITLLFGTGCKKKSNPPPEDLNKHVFGKVYDESDGQPLPHCLVALYQSVNDGSINNAYLKIAETYSDSNGDYAFYFKSDVSLRYAVELLQSSKGSIFSYFPTDIMPEKMKSKEIVMDLKANYLWYYGYINWRVIGNKGSDKCIIKINGGAPTEVLHNQERILRDLIFHTNLIRVEYRVEHQSQMVIDTSFFAGASKLDSTFIDINF